MLVFKLFIVFDNEIAIFKKLIESYDNTSYTISKLSTSISELSDVYSNTKNEDELTIERTLGSYYSKTLLSLCSNISTEADAAYCTYASK